MGKTVKLVANDGKTFDVDWDAALMSKTVKNLLDGMSVS
jgi:Skp1 family protein with oligomerisation domain